MASSFNPTNKFVTLYMYPSIKFRVTSLDNVPRVRLLFVSTSLRHAVRCKVNLIFLVTREYIFDYLFSFRSLLAVIYIRLNTYPEEVEKSRRVVALPASCLSTNSH